MKEFLVYDVTSKIIRARSNYFVLNIMFKQRETSQFFQEFRR